MHFNQIRDKQISVYDGIRQLFLEEKICLEKLTTYESDLRTKRSVLFLHLFIQKANIIKSTLLYVWEPQKYLLLKLY